LNLHYSLLQRDGISCNTRPHVIGIDPGLTNPIYAVDRDTNGKYRKFVLRQRHINRSSGAIKLQKKRNRFHADNVDVFGEMDKVSLKTVSLEKFQEYLKAYYSVYDRIWRLNCELKWSRWKFRIFSRKQHIKDSFIERLRGDLDYSQIKLGYGDADIYGTGPGHSTNIQKRCSDYYPMEMIDEFNTSKCCAICGEVLDIVQKRQSDGELKSIRGLRWCHSPRCCMFIGRDFNGALNMLNKTLNPVLRETMRVQQGPPGYKIIT